MPVRTMDPAMAGLFEAERALGSLPLTEAVERLAEREPELREVVRRVATADRATLENDVSPLLGASVAGDPLVPSDISGAIVLRYLHVMSDGGRGELLATPYFGQPR